MIFLRLSVNRYSVLTLSQKRRTLIAQKYHTQIESALDLLYNSWLILKEVGIADLKNLAIGFFMLEVGL